MNRRLGVVLVLILGAIGFLVFQGLRDATTYFLNVDEVVTGDGLEHVGERIRLQGTVVPGSIERRDDGRVDFLLEYRCARVEVRHTGHRPDLFKEDIPVVVVGELDRSPRFHSDEIIVKHTEEYRTEEADNLQLAESAGCRT